MRVLGILWTPKAKKLNFHSMKYTAKVLNAKGLKPILKPTPLFLALFSPLQQNKISLFKWVRFRLEEKQNKNYFEKN